MADKGSGDICGGADFVEIWNPSDKWLDLGHMFLLSDDKSPEDAFFSEDASPFHFPKGSMIAPAGFMLGCKGNKGGDFSFEFGIGDDDTIGIYYLYDVTVAVTRHVDIYDEVKNVTESKNVTRNETIRIPRQMSTFTLTDGGRPGLVWQLGANERWFYRPLSALGSMVILSKVADKGNGEICGGADFVEIFNPSEEWLDIWNLTLSDDKGPEVRESTAWRD